ncbi:RNA polymerase-associated protein rtf1 [Polyrhizophydium stewartii]|uniref:RNA polymerase-associated protein rtf1 n=1 Tax=Polyrhizophydium stewartii TaxID=2732419 RepID=A0ABR4MW92_9FUNG
MDLDDEILALVDDDAGLAAGGSGGAGVGGPGESHEAARKRKRRRASTASDSDDDDHGDDDSDGLGPRRRAAGGGRGRTAADSGAGRAGHELSDEGDEERDDDDDDDLLDPSLAEVRSWNPQDLMGDAEDRRRLAAMSELEREMVLEERQKKIDSLQERTILKKRLSKQAGLTRPKSEQRGQRAQTGREKLDRGLESFRRQRESRREKLLARGNSDDDGSQRGKDSLDDDEDRGYRRTRCFVRIGVGSDPTTREQVYRMAQILETPTYHRTYRLANTVTKTALKLAHGKAVKVFLMDIVSNGPFKESEWRRYEQTLKVEGVPMMTADFEEIDEMIKRKKQLIKVPPNIASEKLRLRHELQVARERGDHSQVQALSDRIFELDQLSEQRVRNDKSHLEGFARLNERNRQSNFTEGRSAEKNVLEQKKNKGAAEYDPFARRKTAPKHVVGTEQETGDEKAAAAPAAPAAPAEPAQMPSSAGLPTRPPNKSPKPPKAVVAEVTAVLADDDFLDSIDISALEKEFGH